ncbi:MAG: sulfatase [Sediminibacterium magnilacihabitans]|nr:sulfatase [Sediminibacterium magnilacihabitans]PQV60228.1 arylsulfatase [Sediminibacterium magnilacihabitans]
MKRLVIFQSKNSLFFLLPLLFLCSSYHQPLPGAGKGDTPPNIIIILMDDMGYGDLECYGGFPYHTPHINQFAAQGMRFTNYYAAQAVCSASRAGLLTGCYPNRLGISGALNPWSTKALNPSEETIAELVKAKGYRTGIIGKWHLGDKEPFLPLQQGFDEFLGLPYSNDMWPINYDGKPITDTTDWKSKYPPLPLYEGNKKIRVINTLEDQSLLTTLYTERAVQFIKQNKQRPFFLYLAHAMVHVPIAASAKFRGKSGAGLFGDVMEEVDWSIGTVMKTLEEQGLTKNTLVIFTSDNGPWLTFGNHAGNSGALREGKGTAWDGGLKVPCIIRWPGKIAAGAICNNMVAAMDILPTVVNICGAAKPAKKIDGVDIKSLLFQQQGANPRDEFVYYYDNNSLKAIRKGQWKLTFPCISQTYKKLSAIGNDGWPGKYAKDSVQLALYDLRTDPGETLDVQEKHKDIVAQLSALADQYRKELGDDLTKQTGSGVRPAAVVNRK